MTTEPFGLVGALDDLHRPSVDFGERCFQFPARITAVGEDKPQPWKAMADGGQDVSCPVTVLCIGGMDDRTHQKTLRIRFDVPFANHEAVQNPPDISNGSSPSTIRLPTSTNFPRHAMSSSDYQALRSEAMVAWREIAKLGIAA